MSDLIFQGTKVRFNKSGDSVADLEFLGFVSSTSFDSLVPKLVESTHKAQALFVRMDRATTLACFDKDRPNPAFSEYDSPPGCIIVRRDQWQACFEYSQMLGRHGIKRAIFLQDQLEQAKSWLLRQEPLNFQSDFCR